MPRPPKSKSYSRGQKRPTASSLSPLNLRPVDSSTSNTENTNKRLVAERAQIRESRARQRAEARNKLKQEGNDLFKQARYSEAAKKYEQAVNLGGKKPVLLTNLAATYLKLGLFDQAEEIATEALIHDPSNVKARYRRALARKEQRRAIGAIIDFETILRFDPGIPDVASELRATKRVLEQGENSFSDDQFTESEYEWPPYDKDDRAEVTSDSGSSDCEHSGNGISCKYYNQGRCTRGNECLYSHAPDDRSIRDRLGRNVCLFHILDCCEFGAKCMYSHDKAYLPDKGWWKNEELVEALFQEVLMVRLHIPHGEDERQVVDMIHKLISSGGLNPPRDIDTIRTRGTWGHNLNLLHKAREEGESFVNALVAVATSPGYVMVLSLRCENWIQDNKQFVCTLREKVHIKQVFTAKMALSFMNSRDLWGIFIIDFGIADAENSRLLNKIVEYAKAGGLVAVGGLFSRHMSNPRLQLFFRAWGLPWDLGACDGTSATFERNPASEMVQKNPSLPSSSNMKAVHLRGVAKECAVYLSNPCSALPTNDIKRTEEFAVVRTRIGKGYFGYIGGNEEGVSVTILLAMLGLLDDTTENSGLPDLVRGHVQNLLQPRNPLYDDSRRVRRAGRKAWSNTLTEGLLDAGMDRYEIRDLVRAGSGPSFDF